MGKFDWTSFGQSAASGVLNQLFSWFGASQQHKRNKELMSLQNDYTMQQMAQSNEYWQQQNETQVGNQMQLTRQNPILQMEGVKQAGMNPNAQFSGNVAAAPSGTNAPSGNGVGNPGASNPFTTAFDLFGKMKELELASKDLDIKDEQVKNISANTEYVNSQKDYQDIQNKYADDYFTKQNENLVKLGKELEEKAGLEKKQAEEITKNLEWLDKLKQADLEKISAETDVFLKELKKIDQEIEESKSRAAYNKAAANAANAAAEESRANAALAAEKTRTQKVETAIAQLNYRLKSMGISTEGTDAYTTLLRHVACNPKDYGLTNDESREFIAYLTQRNATNDDIKVTGGKIGPLIYQWRTQQQALKKGSITQPKKQAPSSGGKKKAPFSFHDVDSSRYIQ